MKLSSILVTLSFTAVPTALGAAVPATDVASLEPRFGSTGQIVGAIQKVKAAVDDTYRQAAKVKNNDKSNENFNNLVGIATKAQALSNTLAKQTSVVKKASNIPILGTPEVQFNVEGLIKSVEKLVDAIINLKPIINRNGLGGVVLSLLKSQKTAADKFADALTSKVPAEVQFLAVQDKQRVDDALNKGIRAFKSS